MTDEQVDELCRKISEEIDGNWDLGVGWTVGDTTHLVDYIASVIRPAFEAQQAENERLKQTRHTIDMIIDSFNTDVAHEYQKAKMENRNLEADNAALRQQVADLQAETERQRKDIDDADSEINKLAAEIGKPLNKTDYVMLRGAATVGDVLGEVAGKVHARIADLERQIKELAQTLSERTASLRQIAIGTSCSPLERTKVAEDAAMDESCAIDPSEVRDLVFKRFDALSEQVEELRRDAERWRKARKYAFVHSSGKRIEIRLEPGFVSGFPQQADAAIDAAREQQP